MKTLHWIALILAIIGAINWGLVGLFEFDLVAALFGGQDSALSRIIYTLVGLAGVALIVTSSMLYTEPGLQRTRGTAGAPH